MDERELEEVALGTLESLGRMPAIPYYEDAGAVFVREFCSEAGLVIEADRHGNVLVQQPGRDVGAPGLAFVAHLDHPGFEAFDSDGARIIGKMLGRLPDAAMESGVAVQFVTRDGRRVPGKVAGRVGAPQERTISFDVDTATVGELPCAVVLDLPDFKLDGNVVRMRALDDLAGCAATLGALRWAAAAPAAGTVYGLFTRAEEDGLVGARLAAAEGLLPHNTTVVSVESSHALPGAEIGKGPVIRVGDRTTTFDRGAEAYLQTAAERLRRDRAGFQYQRQLMTGGVCEASAFAAFGYRVTGLAFPLGNYHNGLYEGVVDAEYVDLGDFLGGVRLLAEAALLAGTEPALSSAAWLRERPATRVQRPAGPA